MPSDIERVKNGDPIGPGLFSIGTGPHGQKALGPGKRTDLSTRQSGTGWNLPTQPQDHLKDSSTGSSGDQAKDLEKIVNGNGGPRTGSSGAKGSGVSWGPNAGGVGNGPGPGGNGNGNGNGVSKKSKKKGPGRITKGVGGVGKGILKGLYKHRPGYGRRQEEVLARPRAEKIAQEQFGITQDTSELTYYQLLGLEQTATQAKIRSAWAARVKVIHPDKSVGLTPEGAEAIRLVNEAYETLKNPARRKAYDDRLRLGMGSYEAMTPRMRKKAMGQARTGMKYEQDIKNEASALGIPLKSIESLTIKVGSMSPGVMRAWAIQNGLGDTYDLNPDKFRGRYKEVEVTSKQEVVKPVFQLARDIASVKGDKVSAAAYLADQEDELKRLRPSRAAKIGRGLGKAVVGGSGLASKAIESSGRSGVGKTVRTTRSDYGALRDIQAPGLGKIRAAGAGGIKRGQGALRVQSPFGRLPVSGKPVRRRKKGF